jgi:hypothetical protein
MSTLTNPVSTGLPYQFEIATGDLKPQIVTRQPSSF